MSSAADQYRRAWHVVEDVGRRIRPTSWDSASPCPSWNARQLVGHLVDGQRQIQAMLHNVAPPTPITDPATLSELAGQDPAAALHRAAGAVEASLHGLDPATVISTPRGEFQVQQVLSMALIEPVIHAWDLATATGQRVTLDDEPVRTLLAGVEQLGDQLAATGMYAPAFPAPAGGSDVQRLLAAVGRRTI